MGCLNSQGQFEHWFANIHLSGPCNRACYFCIGQHMMALDPLNNLDTFPLKNLNNFTAQLVQKGINEVNVTGSNTDPLLYKHTLQLKEYLLRYIPNLKFGIRTNGVLALPRFDIMDLYDKGSISVTTFNEDLYVKTMGMGAPPPLTAIVKRFAPRRLKANVVLCPETVQSGDIFNTIDTCLEAGIQVVNFREPYGQPHIGDPCGGKLALERIHLGMPSYDYHGMEVTYWDVHYVEVESINLYANGTISSLYPITKGHDPVYGNVKGQENFVKSGRVTKQWLKVKEEVNYGN
jgi:MoaA/NifB/PqqE/SkfB family radical SAM enzyme